MTHPGAESTGTGCGGEGGGGEICVCITTTGVANLYNFFLTMHNLIICLDCCLNIVGNECNRGSRIFI